MQLLIPDFESNPIAFVLNPLKLIGRFVRAVHDYNGYIVQHVFELFLKVPRAEPFAI